MINYLVQKNLLCHMMREKFEFWIVPMLNPDGVIVGNYRTNLQGKDLNRHYYADDDPEGH